MPEDQDAVDSQEGSKEVTETSDDNQTETDQKQSESETDKPVFKDAFGNEYTPEDFQAKFREIETSFTKKAQEASQARKELEALKSRADSDARKAVSESEQLKEVPPDVREAIISIVKPLFEEQAKQSESKRQQEEADKRFETELHSLEGKYDGKNGLPKFDRNKVLKEMQDPNNRIYDPEELYLKLNRQAHNDYLIQQALKKTKQTTPTESTGSESKEAPQSKEALTWAEAAKRAASRISQ